MTAATAPLRASALHLLVLSTFAIAQPLFDLLGRHPAFFAAHEVGRWGMIEFALVVLLGPPLVLFAIEWLVRRLFGERAGGALHLIFVGLLFALFALGIVRRAGWAPFPTFALSALLGGLGTVAYRRFTGLRSGLSILGFAPVLFTFLFLFTSNSASLVTGGDPRIYDARGTSQPPIVVVAFDSFPVQLLMDADRKINAERFPNIARLARSATWYPNATNVHENTSFSIPSILDGQVPEPSDAPTVQGHPNNLFTLLGRTYRIRTSEEVTNLCPSGVCARPNDGSAGDRISLLADDVSVVFEYLVVPEAMRDDLPSIDDRWRNFRDAEAGAADGVNPDKKQVLSALADGQRPERYRQSIAGIEGGDLPTLDFVHTLLPHEPLQYLPTGQRYQAGEEHDPSFNGPPSYDNAFLTDQAFQRHLLQVGFADGQVGQLVDRLEAAGLWDDALVVITADHGVAFRVKETPAAGFVPGRLGYRRELTHENVQDIVTIPLFVKYPGQDEGKVDRTWARVIDILPTIADVLGIDLPFEVDGASLLVPRDVPSELTFRRTSGERIVVDVAALERQKRESLSHQIELLGTTWDDAFRIGPHRELIGRAVGSLPRRPEGQLHADIAAGARFDAVQPGSTFLPSHVTGELTGGDPADRELVFALNGTVVSTGVSFDGIGPNRRNFSSLLPYRALRAGRNELQVFELRQADGELGLALLGSAGEG